MPEKGFSQRQHPKSFCPLHLKLMELNLHITSPNVQLSVSVFPSALMSTETGNMVSCGSHGVYSTISLISKSINKTYP